MVRIVDTTLREGAQAAGVRFDRQASAEIARALMAIGIDTIECGHPGVGPEEMCRVRDVVQVCGGSEVLAHARARVDDIDAVAASGAQWVGLFIGVNDLSRRHRLKAGARIDAMIDQAVRHAKSLGLSVRFTIEDASRTEPDALVAGYGTAVRAGADRICFADTVGVLCPWEIEARYAVSREHSPASILRCIVTTTAAWRMRMP